MVATTRGRHFRKTSKRPIRPLADNARRGPEVFAMMTPKNKGLQVIYLQPLKASSRRLTRQEQHTQSAR
jgi:hypothetical protein